MNLTLSTRQLSLLAALGLLTACGGETTLDEVAPRTTTAAASCDADGGVCDVGDVPVRGDFDIVEVDCCEMETDVEESLCEALYTNTLPDGLVVVDTCDEPRSAQNDEDEDEDEDEEPSGDEDPCAGLSGIEQLICEFGGGAAEPEPEPAEENPLGGLIDLLGGGGGEGGLDLGGLLGLLGGGGGETGGFDWTSLLGGGDETGGFDWTSLLGGGGETGGFDWTSLLGGNTEGDSGR